jgi:replication-associated recombination protein RarA
MAAGEAQAMAAEADMHVWSLCAQLSQVQQMQQTALRSSQLQERMLSFLSMVRQLTEQQQVVLLQWLQLAGGKESC